MREIPERRAGYVALRRLLTPSRTFSMERLRSIILILFHVIFYIIPLICARSLYTYYVGYSLLFNESLTLSARLPTPRQPWRFLYDPTSNVHARNSWSFGAGSTLGDIKKKVANVNKWKYIYIRQGIIYRLLISYNIRTGWRLGNFSKLDAVLGKSNKDSSVIYVLRTRHVVPFSEKAIISIH